MLHGALHALQNNERHIALMFSEYRPYISGGAMKARRFYKRESLSAFLMNRVLLEPEAEKNLMNQLASKRSGSIPDIYLTGEQLLELGL